MFVLAVKKNCVFKDGKGIEIDPTKSAKIFYKLGLVYSKRCDRISLIKSVGLLNSAIERKPDNVFKIEKDLYKVCQHILSNANAQDQNADLIEQANRVKSQFTSMRYKTNQALTSIAYRTHRHKANLKQTDKINLIAKIQFNITEHYKKIMKNLCQYCVDVMGSPPCKFAVVGMGSLARKEITPYSDFEHIILLEMKVNCEKYLEYFRWLSALFHTIILNLQETIIPSLNIMYLNDNTQLVGDWFYDNHTSGVSFDGMMPHACKFPLGRTQLTETKQWRTELIKPVDEMLEYLSSEESLKNGYHLSDILTQTCFVYGDQTLHHSFEIGVKIHKNSKTQEEMLDEVKKEVEKDLDKFATRIKLANLKPNDVLNVKQMFFRTSTLFIGALGKMCNAKSLSSFDIIDELAERKILSDNAKFKLSFAVAISCEVRLRVYMNAKSQRDYIQPRENAETLFDEILKIIDIESIISYFQITYSLQCEIVRLLGIKETHIYSNYRLINIALCYALKQNNLMLALLKNYEDTKTLVKNSAKTVSQYDFNQKTDSENAISFEHFDDYILRLEDEVHEAMSFDKCLSQPNPKSIYDNLFNVVDSLHKNGDFSEAVEFLMRVLELLQHSTLLSDRDYKKISEEAEVMDIDAWISWIKLYTSDYLIELNRFVEASELLKQVVEECNTQSYNPEDSIRLFFNAGNNYFKTKEYEKSLHCLQTSLGMNMSDIFFENRDYVAMISLSGIGACLLHLGCYEESLDYLESAIRMIVSCNITKDDENFAFNRVTTYHKIGKCLSKLHRYEDALSYLYQALDITREDEVNEGNVVNLIPLAEKSLLIRQKVKELASICRDIGLCHMKQNRFKDALNYFSHAFNIHHHYKAIEVSETRAELLNCLMEIYRRERVESIMKDLHESRKKRKLFLSY